MSRHKPGRYDWGSLVITRTSDNTWLHRDGPVIPDHIIDRSPIVPRPMPPLPEPATNETPA